MLFHTVEFALFLPIVFALYVLSGRISLRAQNLLLLVASYIFYGWWDPRFLILIAVSSLVDYIVGLKLADMIDGRGRRVLLIASLVTNLGVLGFFKYYNFFVDSFISAFGRLGVELHAPTLHVILPVGISFYTFQTITYTIAIYRRTLTPTKDIIAFFAYVSFFPQLVAGPIERAGHLLPQFLRSREITADNIISGLKQIAWGLFCKVVVADNCAVVANAIFAGDTSPPGNLVLVGAFFFAFQIYGDFSGYSHIALGTARTLGFELMQNFATPYFSQSIPEFWRRWHISLSTWFRDYVYIPLGGNRVSKARQALNLLITFTISGLWHGANWTFVLWGFLNGLYSIPRLFIGEPLARFTKSRIAVVRWGTVLVRTSFTFFLILIAWIFFRAETASLAFAYLGELFSRSVLASPASGLRDLGMLSPALFAGTAILSLLILEWFQRDKLFALEFERKPAPVRWAVYAIVAALMLTLRYTGESLDFIYFQF